MKVNFYNSEGYLDPTVYEALTNIERDKKKKREYREKHCKNEFKHKTTAIRCFEENQSDNY